MADKPTITTLSSGQIYDTTTLNTNFAALRDHFENVLGTNGTTGADNLMTGDLDMNNKTLRNVVFELDAGDYTLSASAITNQYTFSSTTTMAAPGTGTVRLNNATLASVTQIAIQATSGDSSNPDISDYIASWDNSSNTNKGYIRFSKIGAPGTFLIVYVNSSITDNTTWLQIPVTYVASNGSFSDGDSIFISFTAVGDAGAGTGDVTLTGTQTLTNKTLTSAILTTPIFADGGYIADSNGNEMLIFDSNTSATDNFQISNVATGNRPTLSVVGSTSNISMAFQAKGTGTFNFLGTSTTSAEIGLFEDTDNGTNKVTLKAPDSIASNITWVLPQTDVTNGYIKSDGAGNLSLATISTGFTVGTPVATTSGTSNSFTGVASTATQLIVMLNGVSTNGTSRVMLQLRDSGGVETSGYIANGGYSTNGTEITTGFPISDNQGASDALYGTFTLTKYNGNEWLATWNIYQKGQNKFSTGSGTKTLSGTLDGVVLTTVSGADTFDAGGFNVNYI